MTDATPELPDLPDRAPAATESFTWRTFAPAQALPVLGTAGLLALIAQLLTRGAGLGLNFTLITLALVLATLLLTRREARSRSSLLLLSLAVVFAGFVAWRDMTSLTVLNVLAALTASALGLRYLRAPGRFWAMTPLAPLRAVGMAGVHVAIQGAGLPSRTEWRSLRGPVRARAWVPFLRGALLAAPVLGVFGLLLASADAAFGALLARAFRWDLSFAAEHTLVWLWWAWVLAGALYCGVLARAPRMPLPEAPAPLRLGGTEVAVVLGSLVALFAAFMAVQGTYLFGGQGQVTALTGLTYAEYARRGFFELLTVTLLCVPLLLGLRSTLPRELRDARRSRVLNLLVTALLAGLLVSAWQRMGLYIRVYGLSELRVLAGTGMVWVAIVLALFAAGVWRARLDAFTAQVLLAGFCVLMGLNFANPGLWIARDLGTRATVAPSQRAAQIMAQHLGADAAPYVLPNLQVLAAGRPELASALQASVGAGGARGDWRAWNLARSRAGQLRP